MPVRIIFENDVLELRDVVEREVGDLDHTISACTGHVDAVTAHAWQQAKQVALDWAARVHTESSSVWISSRWGELYTQGRGLETVLRESWWPRLQALGCTLPFAQPGAPREPGFSSDSPGNPLSILASLEGLAKTLLLVMIWREVKEWMS
jgi:hypothetical protein